jgi:hypothetical protein
LACGEAGSGRRRAARVESFGNTLHGRRRCLTHSAPAAPKWQETMNRPETEKFFLVHVMKTAGTTFRVHAVTHFGRAHVYPNTAQDDMGIAYRSTDYLTALPAERHASIRCYTGHFPFYVTKLLPTKPVTLTILRDPVDRTISRLKHRQELDPPYRSCALEEIYDDPVFFTMFIKNYQSKIFSMTPMDVGKTHWDFIEVDEQRLATAKDNIATVDIVGFQDEYDAFLDELRRRYGWPGEASVHRRASGQAQISRSFRRRIERDNAADIEFYNHALDVRSSRPR